MTLDTGKINETYTIEKLELPLKLEKRLEALGMTEGTSILILNAKMNLYRFCAVPCILKGKLLCLLIPVITLRGF